MNPICRKLVLSLALSLVLISLCGAVNLKGHKGDSDEEDDCDDDDEWKCDNFREWKLSDGAIAAIVISVLVVFFGIPILLCWLCAWCCFRNRRKIHHTVVAAAPIAPQYPQQQYHNGGGQPQIFVTHSLPYNEPNQNAYPSSRPSIASSSKSNNPPSVQSFYQGDTGHQYSNLEASDMSHIYEQPPPYYFGDNVADNHSGSSDLPPKRM